MNKRIGKILVDIGLFFVMCFLLVCVGFASTGKESKLVKNSATIASAQWSVVDTDQSKCYGNSTAITCPSPGSAFYGQDAHYDGNQPRYTDNGDGTVTDNVTGLMWQQDPGDKMTWSEASAGASSFGLAGYTDWRLPTIKEMYSLIQFSGTDPFVESTDSSGLTPFIDTDFFVFKYGDTSAGERIIDSQYTTSTKYVGTTMNGAETVFGVNFADGRIKGYGISDPRGGGGKTFHVMYVRGNSGYGENNFVDNGDGTVTDLATGLMWMQKDSGHLGAGNDGDGGLNWQQALDWAENLTYAGHSDWRLPNAKELQSIVDYSRSPSTTNSPAIDPVFETTGITDEGGNPNYPFYWSSTSHVSANGRSAGAYVAFGEALGWMQFGGGSYQLMDVHGAGAQRGDPKTGDPAEYPYGHGPQGDVVRIYNYVRCVRTATVTTTAKTLTVQSSPSGVAVTVSPADNNGSANGAAAFTRSYDAGTAVTLTAPATASGRSFSKWTVAGTDYTAKTVQVTMNSDKTATVYYEDQSGGVPVISLNRTRYNFGYLLGGRVTPPRVLRITNGGEGTLNWSASSSDSWLRISSAGGSGDGRITISVNASGLSVGKYTGTISVSASGASNSPQTVTVRLSVFATGRPPFGSFDAPGDASATEGSVAVSGWVLDDLGVEQVLVCLRTNGTDACIGEAVLVEGARSDVALNYPDYPNNEQAGWGYMLLTNMLPGGGNGTYTLAVKVRDVEGNTETLGTKTVTCDNAGAENPFGAIDTPSQGGTASGDSFVNYGWALTPRPNSISGAGSSIVAYVDSVPVGNAAYGSARTDIAGLFPGYVDSQGAGGYFILDTTAYENGPHTIAWLVTDSAGNSQGVGSRYFTVLNSAGTTSVDGLKRTEPERRLNSENIVKVSLNSGNGPERDISVLEPLEIHLPGGNYKGYVRVGDEYRPLPVGSTFDRGAGIFYWMPLPGFHGEYRLEFMDTHASEKGNGAAAVSVTVNVDSD